MRRLCSPLIKTKIHPTAIIDKKAKLDTSVEIGAYSVIGADVKVSKGTQIMNHVTLSGNIRIGERCVIYPGACIGVSPQVRNKKFTETSLVVGNDNVIREYATISTGIVEGSQTSVGDHNYLMAGVHVGHDCHLGNDITIANGTVLGGHVIIEDHATLSGLVGVHQYVRIGKLSMTGGLSKVTVDVPPYSICDGHPAKFYGVNSVGLKRAGMTSKDAALLRQIFRILLKAGTKISDEIPKLRKEYKNNVHAEAVFYFLSASERGFCRVE